MTGLTKNVSVSDSGTYRSGTFSSSIKNRYQRKHFCGNGRRGTESVQRQGRTSGTASVESDPASIHKRNRKVKAVQLKCIGELSKRIARKSAKRGLSLNHPQTIADYYMEQLRHEEQEQLFLYDAGYEKITSLGRR